MMITPHNARYAGDQGFYLISRGFGLQDLLWRLQGYSGEGWPLPVSLPCGAESGRRYAAAAP